MCALLRFTLHFQSVSSPKVRLCTRTRGGFDTSTSTSRSVAVSLRDLLMPSAPLIGVGFVAVHCRLQTVQCRLYMRCTVVCHVECVVRCGSQFPWKSVKSIIEYYYMWKTTDRYLQQVRPAASSNSLHYCSPRLASPPLCAGRPLSSPLLSPSLLCLTVRHRHLRFCINYSHSYCIALHVLTYWTCA